jgi:hypothetical protein
MLSSIGQRPVLAESELALRHVGSFQLLGLDCLETPNLIFLQHDFLMILLDII